MNTGTQPPKDKRPDIKNKENPFFGRRNIRATACLRAALMAGTQKHNLAPGARKPGPLIKRTFFEALTLLKFP